MSTTAAYIHCQNTVAKVMRQVLYSLIPGILIAFFHLGFGVLIQIFIAVACALVCEAIALGMRRQAIWPGLTDGSALVTACLFALTISPFTSWWLTCIGVAFAVIVVKHCYGGLGYNLFNPAMAGYIFILLSFPEQLTLWPKWATAVDLDLLETIAIIFASDHSIEVDADVSLLYSIQSQLSMQIIALETWVASSFGSVGWGWIEIGFLLGGLWLIFNGVISWHIPFAIIAALFSISATFYIVDSSTYLPPVVHLFSGGTLLCAFFIATDPVSAATTPKGRLIYAVGIGLLIYVIRTWAVFADSVAFAVLIMNCAAPLIDQYTRPLVLDK